MFDTSEFIEESIVNLRNTIDDLNVELAARRQNARKQAPRFSPRAWPP